MHTPFSIVINRFLKLSELTNEEAEYARNLIIGPGQNVIHFDGDLKTLMKEPKPCHSAMESFLLQIPGSMLTSLFALMQCGRLDEADPVLCWRHLKGNFEKPSDLIESIGKNVMRGTYIAKAMEAMSGSYSIDDIPRLLSIESPLIHK